MNFEKLNREDIIKCDTYEEAKELCELLDNQGYRPGRHKWIDILNEDSQLRFINLKRGLWADEEWEKIKGFTVINFKDIAPKYYYKATGEWRANSYLNYNTKADCIFLGSKSESEFYKTIFTKKEYLDLSEKKGFPEHFFEPESIDDLHLYKVKGEWGDLNYLKYDLEVDEIYLSIPTIATSTYKGAFTHKEFEELCEKFRLNQDFFEEV